MEGGSFQLGLSYEFIEVEETTDRFINTFYEANELENENRFIGAEATYNFKNKDNDAYPTLGMEFEVKTGYKSNTESSDGFGYVVPSLSFDHRLTPNGQLVLATKLKGHFNLGDQFEFYQGATLGASDGLRGYRNQRFTGNSAFYQSTDLRLNLRKIKTGLLPFNFGIYGGVDYGRVWLENENSDDWDNWVGGGIFFNGLNKLVGNISAFNSDDGLRLAFRLGFAF